MNIILANLLHITFKDFRGMIFPLQLGYSEIVQKKSEFETIIIIGLGVLTRHILCLRLLATRHSNRRDPHLSKELHLWPEKFLKDLMVWPRPC